MGTNVNYPWHRWADGCKWTLRHGHDFTCAKKTFVRHVATKAADMQRHVNIRSRGSCVIIQFGGYKSS